MTGTDEPVRPNHVVSRTAPAPGRRPGTLVVVGSGIRAIGHFSLEAQAYLKWADKVYYCVADPVTEQWMVDQAPDSVDLYTLYDNDKPRRITYVQMAEVMLQSVREGLNVVGVFYGHPGVFVNPSHRAIAIARQEGHAAFMVRPFRPWTASLPTSESILRVEVVKLSRRATSCSVDVRCWSTAT